MGNQDAKAKALQAVWTSVILIILLGVLKQLHFHPTLQKLGFTVAVAFQLYVPLWLIDRSRERSQVYGLHMHGSVAVVMAFLRRNFLGFGKKHKPKTAQRYLARLLSRFVAPYAHNACFDSRGFWRDIKQVTLLCIFTFPFFAVGHHYWQVWMADMRGRTTSYSFQLPESFGEILIINLLLVALPEELFYRGFVQTRLLRAMPPWTIKYGVPVGWAILVTSGLFALGHYSGEFGNPARLGPFFPALVFSAMRARSGAIMGAVIYHGLSNVFSETLRTGYTFS